MNKLKNIAVVALCSLLFACGKEKVSYLHYYMWPAEVNGEYREYVYRTDSSRAQIFLKQKYVQLNDTLWQCDFEWKDHNLKPTLSGTEKVSVNNYIERVEYFVYEKTASDKAVKIPAEFLDSRSTKLTEPVIRGNCIFRLKKDTTVRLKVYTEVKNRTYAIIDTLGINCEDCAVAYCKAVSTLESSNGQKISSETNEVRILEKYKGLIAIIETTPNGTRIFKLNE
jgi:hypothetical protein